MPDSTPSSIDSPAKDASGKAPWWTRLGLLVCVGVIILWTLRPGAAGRFQPVPIAKEPAPAWAVTNVFGSMLSSSNLAGQVLVVNFWATWCPPCVREIPDLNAFHLAHTNDRVSVIGFSVDTAGTEAVRDFVTRNRMAYPVALVPDAVTESFGAMGPIPTTYIIDRSGRFVARYLGPLPREELERVTAPLIAAP